MAGPPLHDASRPLGPRELVTAGERVTLRPVGADDAEWVFDAVHANEAILRWICWAGPESVEELLERYSEWRRGEGAAADYQLAVCENATGRGVGTISLKLREAPGRGELGYWIATDAQGRGYAGEAVELATALAFERLGAEVLFAWVFVGNEPSRRLLERNGFRLEFTSTAPVPAHGRDVDQWYFALTRADWVALRAAREAEAGSAEGS